MTHDIATDHRARPGFTVGLIMGGIAGAVAALAFAPRAGADLRRSAAGSARNLGAMTSLRTLAIASVVVLSATPVTAQQLSHYRTYLLGSSVASVARISGARDSDIRTLHERPAKLQQLEWHAPYVRSGTELADPVHDVSFHFCDDQLYQVIVTYDRDRMDGLTDDDVVGSLSVTYDVPSRTRSVRGALPADLPADTVVVARWEDAESLVILTRRIDAAPFQLLVISKTLNARARAAIKQALWLDVQEAPQRERDLRKKEVADAREASQKARVVNKAAFRP